MAKHHERSQVQGIKKGHRNSQSDLWESCRPERQRHKVFGKRSWRSRGAVRHGTQTSFAKCGLFDRYEQALIPMCKNNSGFVLLHFILQADERNEILDAKSSLSLFFQIWKVKGWQNWMMNFWKSKKIWWTNLILRGPCWLSNTCRKWMTCR